MISTALIGMLPTILIFAAAFMRIENREPWHLVTVISFSLLAFSWVVFDYLLALPWPRPVLAILFPNWVEFVPSW